MEKDKTPPEFYGVKYYCEDEDKYLRINIPFGTSSEDFFKNKPTCLRCGNQNCIPVVIKHPSNPPENTKMQEIDFEKTN